MPYRESARWGEVVSTHRTSIVSWVLAFPLGLGGAMLCIHFAAKGGSGALKLGIGALLMGGLTVWVVAEIVRLRRIVLNIHERGLIFRDARELHEVDWTDIRAVEAQYVPGALRRGTSDPGNIVTLVVSGPSGAFSLPKELSKFREIVETVRARSKAPWSDTLIANLMHRS